MPECKCTLIARNLFPGRRIVNLGDERVPKLTQLQTKTITTASDSTTELEPFDFSHSQRGFGQNGQTVIQAWDDPPPE